MKKTFALSLLLASSIGLAACDNEPERGPPGAPLPPCSEDVTTNCVTIVDDEKWPDGQPK